ncbi:MAG: hypothetical protein N2321_09090 [Melioribacteraceae bacterium]|nr:hypothetical protein [Melioribacteraceae bacterium]
MIKNTLTCNICKKENPLYSLNCINCQSFLRSKIANIDFWDIAWKILYEPVLTFQKIIQADKKNYLILISFLILIRFSFLDYIITNIKASIYHTNEATFNLSLLKGTFIILTITLFSYLLTYVLKLIKIQTRPKDNFTILAFSFLPNVISSIFLLPFQIALFGLYWFTFNPSPLIIKPLQSIIFYIIELSFIIWSIFLIIISIYTQSSKLLLSIFLSFILLITLIMILIN